MQRLGNGLGDPNGLSLPYTTLGHIRNAEFHVTEREREVLRDLAQRVLELSQRGCEQEKISLWKAHNGLRQKRPMVFIDVENGWYEIIPHTSLQCVGNLARIWEFRLRKELYWGEVLCDDRVITDIFPVQHVYDVTDFGIPHVVLESADLNGAYHWIADVKDYQTDLPKLHRRSIHVDEVRTQQLFNLAEDIFGGILQVRMDACFWWSLGLTWDLMNLRGMEGMMLDMYENPKELHTLMALLRDDALCKLDFLEQSHLLTLNHAGNYVGSGGFGWTDELPQKDFDGAHVRTCDLWGFCESQETLGISPEMFAEFIFAYQKPILERFGLNCYGCCEPLDKRWHVVKQTPNLRRVSVSAWADREKMAEYLGKDYVYSWKPSPTALAVSPVDEDAIAKGIRETLKIAKDCNLEIIMKDNHTICNDAWRARRWVQIVQEEIARR